MEISIIAALAENYVIGSNNQIPWKLSDDMKFFKKITLNKTILLGRKTFESLGRPLPRRENLVLSRSKKNSPEEGVTYLGSMDQVIRDCSYLKDLMIIGGAGIYKLFLPIATRLYLTWVHKEVEGDTLFPEFDLSKWEVVEDQYFSEGRSNQFDFTIVQYQKLDTTDCGFLIL